MVIKCLGGRCRGFAGLAVDAAREGLQQLFGILKIAAPHEPRSFAGQAIGRVGGGAIVGDDYAFRRRDCIFRAPARGLFGACFAPLNRRWFPHGSNRIVGKRFVNLTETIKVKYLRRHTPCATIVNGDAIDADQRRE